MAATSRNIRRVAVVGGGISGLAAAHHLRKMAAAGGVPIDVVVLERESRIGGTIETLHTQGFVAETGPDALLAGYPAARELATHLGLEAELVGIRNEARKTFVVYRGKLVEIPGGCAIFGMPGFWQFATTPLFSVRGKLRVAIEPFIRPRRDEGDESLHSLITRRFGNELFDRVAQPLLGGIYSGDPRLLSSQATMPRLVDFERRHGSIIRGLLAGKREAAKRNAQERSEQQTGMLQSFRCGMASLIDALAKELRGTVWLESEAERIGRTGENLWRILTKDGREITADSVICAAPAWSIGRMLGDTRLGRLLEAIPYSSIATVNLAFDRGDAPQLPAGTGFVIPQLETKHLVAATFSSLKFPDRAPDGAVLIRAFTHSLEADDVEILGFVREEFRTLLGIRATPAWTHVKRWPRALPECRAGHLDRVAEIERELKNFPGLALAGAAYRGIGIPNCIESGGRAAAAILSYLANRPPAHLNAVADSTSNQSG